VSGFLKKSDIAEDARPKAGALLDVVVQSAADKRLVTVTAAREAVAAATLKDDAATDLGGLPSVSVSLQQHRLVALEPSHLNSQHTQHPL
jgi:hypothetical protein